MSLVSSLIWAVSVSQTFFSFILLDFRWTVVPGTAVSVAQPEGEDEQLFLKNGKPCPAQPYEAKLYI